MPRGSLRHYSSRGRRSSVQWDAALIFLLFAIVGNFAGLYLIHLLLLVTFEPWEPPEKRPEVLEFGLYPDDMGDELTLPNDGDGERPDPDSNDRANPSEDDTPPSERPANRPQPDAQPPEEPVGRPDAAGSGEDQGVGDDQGATPDEQVGPSNDDLVAAPDGELAGSGDAQGGVHGKPDPLAGLGGSTSLLDKTFGPPPAADRVRDVDEGTSSVLDNKRHLYGSFFNRIRDGLSEHWAPNKVNNRVDPDRSRYGESTRTTVLMIRLDASGKLLKAVVVQKSGAPHLDEEALRTVKAASPFPNPPPGLVNASGFIEFPFGFVLEASGKARMFRVR